MTAERIAEVVAAGKSETLELKSTTGARCEAARTICAMLNQQGGQLLFGVTAGGHVTGQEASEQTLELLSAELARIDPPAFPAIERIQLGASREVAAVYVCRGQAGPCMYRGSAYRRMGNTTLKTPAAEYQRLLFERMHSERRWENQSTTSWSVEDLDANEIRTAVEEAVRRGRLDDPGTRDTCNLLRGLRLLPGGALCRAAVALFAKEGCIRFAMPQCLLRVARFTGNDRTEFLDNRQFCGNAFALLRTAERFLRESRPLLAALRKVAWSVSTFHSFLRWQRVRPLRTRSAIATTR